VDYLLGGGAAATAHGAQRPTEDADCVVSQERANLDRLAQAMRELNARLRVAGMTDDEAKLLPVQLDGTTLADLSITTWMTDAGAFDVLAGLEAEDGHLVPYEELVQHASVLQGDGFVIRAVGLDDIIAPRSSERIARRIGRRFLSCGPSEIPAVVSQTVPEVGPRPTSPPRCAGWRATRPGPWRSSARRASTRRRDVPDRSDPPLTRPWSRSGPTMTRPRGSTGLTILRLVGLLLRQNLRPLGQDEPELQR